PYSARTSPPSLPPASRATKPEKLRQRRTTTTFLALRDSDMKRIAFVVAAAFLFAFAPIAGRFGPVPSSIALVWLGVLLPIFASGASASHGFPLAIGAGALGAFGAGVLGPTSAAAAGAVMVAAAFVERTTRVRSRNGRALHVLLALVGGALAGSLSEA